MSFLSKSSPKTHASQNDALGVANDSPIQAKLRYGQPGDSYEQEADRVADNVVSNGRNSASPAAVGNSISNHVQRQPDEKKDDAAAQEDQQKQQDEAVQKKENNKKDDEKAIQKKDDKKDEEKKPVQKKEDKKDQEKPVQKKEDKKEDEKKPVQKKEEKKKEEDKPVQKKEEGKKEEEKAVQKKSTDKKEDEKQVQKKEAGSDKDKKIQKKESDNPKAEEPEVEKQIKASQNAGKPMDDDVRKEMEKQFGKDFKNVIIHNDALSYELCRKINAQAFTYGSHIYFAEGKYNPFTNEGKHLLAHELTHVVQQGNEVRRKMVQKANDPPPANNTAPATDTKKNEYEEPGLGKIRKKDDGTLEEVALDHLKVPPLKVPFSPKGGESLPKKTGDARPNDQASIWDSKITLGDEAGKKLDEKLDTALKTYTRLNSLLGNKKIYFLKKRGTTDSNKGIIMGSKADVLAKIKRPQWGKDGKAMPFDVDHQKELQLGGENDFDKNMWLLASFQNQPSGNEIKISLNAQLNKLKTNAKSAMGTVPGAEEMRKQVAVKLLNDPKGELDPKGDAIAYTKNDIQKGAPIDGLEFLNEQTIIDNNLAGSDSKLAIYTSPAGGSKVDIPFDPAKKGQTLPVNKKFGKTITINSVTYTDASATNQVEVTLFEGYTKYLKKPVKFSADLSPSDAVAYGGVLSKQSVLQQLKTQKPDLKYSSPINLDVLDIDDDGLTGKGKLLPSVEIIRKADIDIILNDEGLWLSKTFSLDEINVPSPFKIDACSVTFMLGVGDFKAEGVLDFSIANVGQGSISAKASSEGFSLEGSFKLDEKIFDGEIQAEYHKEGDKESWKIKGTTKIKAGSIPGVKDGTVSVGYDGNQVTAEGDVNLDIKGIEKASLKAQIGNNSFLISGKFTLKKLPGISSGEGEASIEKKGDDYKVKATGKAVPSIKGIDAALSIEYNDGALTIKGSAAYNKGPVTGQVTVVVTSGAPPGEAPNAGAGDGDDGFKIYGGGELSIKITDWLKGTVGVKFDEKNQLVISGKIGIPAPVEVFPKKELPEKDLFSMGTDIPLFGIPLGPKTIGLKARIEGALKAYAGIGPGKLEQLELGVEFNPDHPEETHVTGTGRFAIPAEAGLKLAVRAAVGVDAGIAGVEGGIEVAGGIGLQATASADINVDWMPDKGLDLQANLNADVQPKFTFDIDGYIKAWVLFYKKEWRKKFAHYEYGSNLDFGVTLPIHYKQGEDFNVDFKDIQFRKPDIDPTAMVGNLLRSI